MDRIDRYFDWLVSKVFDKRYSKLLRFLFNQDFYWSVPMDENRYFDGMELRRDFETETGGILDFDSLGDCSVLEVMIALAIRIEDIEADDDYGDRTSKWFWGMIHDLGLMCMTDDEYDEYYISSVLDRFLNRDYAFDGTGSLFCIPNTSKDLRTVEIWYQMCWYLDYILDEGE